MSGMQLMYLIRLSIGISQDNTACGLGKFDEHFTSLVSFLGITLGITSPCVDSKTGIDVLSFQIDRLCLNGSWLSIT